MRAPVPGAVIRYYLATPRELLVLHQRKDLEGRHSSVVRGAPVEQLPRHRNRSIATAAIAVADTAYRR